MIRKIILLITAFLFVFQLAGCSVNKQSAQVLQSIKLDKEKVMYVEKFHADGRNIDQLIAAELIKRGYKAVSGPKVDMPKENIGIIVTYFDKWIWDLRMYMLELDVQFRAPKDRFSLAKGNSYHTSLTSKSPEEMVAEVIGNMLKKIEGQQGAGK